MCYVNIKRTCLLSVCFIGIVSEANRVLIAELDGVHLMVIGMRLHRDNPRVLANAMHALAVLANDGKRVAFVFTWLD